VVSVRSPAAVATAGELRRDDLGHGRQAVEDVLAADRDAAEAVVMRPSYEPLAPSLLPARSATDRRIWPDEPRQNARTELRQPAGSKRRRTAPIERVEAWTPEHPCEALQTVIRHTHSRRAVAPIAP